jgi:hypothetical protein
MIDLSKVILASNYPAFKNDRIYTGTLNISGNCPPGYSEKTYVIPLDKLPDMLTGIFNGPTDDLFSGDPRPASGWFKSGYVWVHGSNPGAGYPDYTIAYNVAMTVSGLSVIIVASTVNQTATTFSLVSTDFLYRIIDYSVF